MSTPQLQLKQVSLQARVGSQAILQDISFTVNQGECVAVVGPSGAGKTYLLRLINRLSELSSGSIVLEGQDIRQIPVIRLRQEVNLVAQEAKLLGMTVREALAYPLRLREMDAATIQQRLLTWSEQLNLPTDWLDRREHELSVGQRQLVALARGLVTQPKIVLLDEPTSALDAGRAARVVEVLKTLAATTQTTVVMVNHQLDVVKQFGDRLLYLQQGRLIREMPMGQVQWPELKQALIRAEQQEAEAWGE